MIAGLSIQPRPWDWDLQLSWKRRINVMGMEDRNAVPFQHLMWVAEFCSDTLLPGDMEALLPMSKAWWWVFRQNPLTVPLFQRSGWEDLPFTNYLITLFLSTHWKKKLLISILDSSRQADLGQISRGQETEEIKALGWWSEQLWSSQGIPTKSSTGPV